MNSGQIRVGTIGTGGWAQYGHIPARQLLKEFEVVAIASRKKETAEMTARKFDIPHALTSILL